MIQLNKIKFNEFLLLLIWILFFYSINLNPSNFFEYSIINKLRLSLPAILSFCYFFYLRKKIDYKKCLNIPSILFTSIFFLYFIFNIFSEVNIIDNIFWPFYMLISFFLINAITSYNEKEFLLKVTITLVALGFLFFLIFILIDMYKHSTYHFYGIYGGSLGYGVFESPPRSSGLSRLSLIIYSFLIVNYLFLKKKKFFLLILILFFAVCTLIFQSRTSSFIFIFINLFMMVFYLRKYFFDKKLIFFAFFFPLIINFFYYFNLQINNPEFDKYILNTSKIVEISKGSIIRDTPKSNYSSGRFDNWKTAINIIKKDPFKGIGAQADRAIIGQSIHNAIIYSTLAGGIIAGLALILIYFYSIYMLFKFYFIIENKLSFNIFAHLSGILIIIFGLRSILETSFAVFSIDYLIYIISFLYFYDHLRKHQ